MSKKKPLKLVEKKVSPIGLVLHDLAKEHPKQTEAEYQRLVESINEMGQIEPVLVYRDKIVDGRHRLWAVTELALPTIKIREIPHKTPLETVREMVFSSEVRRHQTPTQKAIKAWWATQKDGLSYREAEVKFMTNRNMISQCKTISENKGEQALKDLFNGTPVAVGIRTVKTIGGLVKLIQDEAEEAMKARMKEKHTMSHSAAHDYAKLYTGPLEQESTQVLEIVSKFAYQKLKQREKAVNY